MGSGSKRLPSIVYNKITLIGAIMAAVFGLLAAFFLFLHLIVGSYSAYSGLLLFMVFPVLMGLGLVLIPIGMLLKLKDIRSGKAEKNYDRPVINLNHPKTMNAVIVFVIGTIILIFVSAGLSYQGFHYTESVGFCGTTCHSVMKPEFQAYQQSAHARVRCVECHVGSGIDKYAMSKVSGARQVYAILTGRFSRPIQTPIHNLRPARETCEQCHWPSHFSGSREKIFNHTLFDAQNTAWPVRMLIKVGGSQDPVTGAPTGIHWHINEKNKVEYIATDFKRQSIPWVRWTDSNGKVRIFQSKSEPLSQEQVAEHRSKGELRTMECLDCHNRPSHNFKSPDAIANQGIYSRLIDSSLPEIKLAAVSALDGKYETEEEAMKEIANSLRKFYSEKHPEVLKSQMQSLEKAIETVQNSYKSNMFPEMKVKWSEYPNNIGHLYFPGCTRCHDGNHVDSENHVISNKCNNCHTILSQGPNSSSTMTTATDGLEFQHPVDIGDEWKSGQCSACHNGSVH